MPRVTQAERPNYLLASIGAFLLVVASVGFLLDRSAVLAGGFLICGTALTLISVLVRRLEGSQEIGLTGAKINIARTILEGERDLETKLLPGIEEL